MLSPLTRYFICLLCFVGAGLQASTYNCENRSRARRGKLAQVAPSGISRHPEADRARQEIFTDILAAAPLLKRQPKTGISSEVIPFKDGVSVRSLGTMREFTQRVHLAAALQSMAIDAVPVFPALGSLHVRQLGTLQLVLPERFVTYAKITLALLSVTNDQIETAASHLLVFSNSTGALLYDFSIELNDTSILRTGVNEHVLVWGNYLVLESGFPNPRFDAMQFFNVETGVMEEFAAPQFADWEPETVRSLYAVDPKKKYFVWVTYSLKSSEVRITVLRWRDRAARMFTVEGAPVTQILRDGSYSTEKLFRPGETEPVDLDQLFTR